MLHLKTNIKGMPFVNSAIYEDVYFLCSHPYQPYGFVPE